LSYTVKASKLFSKKIHFPNGFLHSVVYTFVIPDTAAVFWMGISPEGTNVFMGKSVNYFGAVLKDAGNLMILRALSIAGKQVDLWIIRSRSAHETSFTSIP